MLETRGAKRFRLIRALDRVTFAVRPGELFGVVGSNDAGKTTTMRILLGGLTAEPGEVHRKGSAIDADRRSSRSSRGP